MKKVKKGKNLESLQRSREIRANFIAKYGYIPTSILIHNRNTRKSIDLCRDSGRRYIDTTGKPENNASLLIHDAYQKTFKYSGAGTQSGALSTFPQDIGRLIIDFYCPKNGIVYDPFAGHNSRMQLVYQSNRNYIGVDISKNFMEANKVIRTYLLKENRRKLIHSKNTIKLIERSSSDVPDVNDEIADFTITSPPYWNLEYYGDESEQLGNAKTYDIFLKFLEAHIKENYRILKKDTFACWFVNDFRKNNIFYPYHSDLINIFIKNGFTPFNVYIIDLSKHPLGAIFVQSIINNKSFPKRHEYCLVFKKERNK